MGIKYIRFPYYLLPICNISSKPSPYIICFEVSNMYSDRPFPFLTSYPQPLASPKSPNFSNPHSRKHWSRTLRERRQIQKIRPPNQKKKIACEIRKTAKKNEALDH